MQDAGTPGQDQRSLAQRTGHAVFGIGLLNVFTFSAQFATAIAIVRRLDRALYGRYAVVATITIIAVQVMVCGGDNSALRFVPEFVVRGARPRRPAAGRTPGDSAAGRLGGAHRSLRARRERRPVTRIRPTHRRPAVARPSPGAGHRFPGTPAETANGSLQRARSVRCRRRGIRGHLRPRYSRGPTRLPKSSSRSPSATPAETSCCSPACVWPGRRCRPTAALSPSGECMRYSVSSMWTTLLNLIVTRQTETVILGAFAASTVVASYNVAYAMPGRVLEFIPAVLYSIGVASVAEAFTVDRTSLPRAIDLYYRALFIVTAPVAVAGTALGGVLTITLFGAAYEGAGHVCQTFFALMPLMLLSAPYVLVVRALEKVWLMTCVLAVEATVNVGLDLLFIPRWGMWGAVGAVAMTFTICVAINLTVYGRLDRTVRPPWRAILRYFAASAPLALLVLPTFWLGAPAALVLGLVLAVPLWLVSARLLRASADPPNRP